MSGGGDADEQPTARRKKLFGHEHRERSADRAADDADFADTVEIEGEKFRVIAGPSFMECCRRPFRLRWRTTSPSGSSTQISGTATRGNCL